MKTRFQHWMFCVVVLLSGCGGADGPSTVGASARSSLVATERAAPHVGQDVLAMESVAAAAKGPQGTFQKALSQDVPAAVFRFFNPWLGTHFYTISVTERDRVQAESTQFQYEGPAFYAMPAGNGAFLAIHRFLNRATGTHFYTSSEAERISVETNLGHVYQYEGVAWRARTDAAEGWVPMRRFYVARTGVHFYTASDQEYTSLLRRRDFAYEGVAYYVRPAAIGAGLDITFGNGGQVASAVTGLEYGSGGSARLADGRLLVGGLCRTGDVHDFCVARYLQDGTLDTTFGAGGWARRTVSTYRATAAAMAVLPDGRIVVGGGCLDLYDVGNRFCMARFSPEGATDAGFGSGGVSRFYVSLLPYGGVGDQLTDIAVAGTDVLYVTGECASRFCVAKVQDDGTLDLSFGNQGVSTLAVPADASEARVVRLDSLGRIVLAGGCRSGADAIAFCMRRLNADGTPDTSFGTDGLTRTVVGGSLSSNITDLHHLQGGGWLATGYCLMGAVSGVDFCAVRYSEDGLQDGSYGTSGSVVQAMQAGALGESSTASLLDTHGRLVMVGTCVAGNYSRSQFCAGRWLADGSIDASFGIDGKLLVDMPGYADIPFAVLQDAAGRLVLSGTCLSSETSDLSPPDFCLARLLP